MNGSQSLLATLTGAGVTTCFANPGTSEMHFVAALDAEPAIRAVLCLFEGVVTGAADGYGRMADRPAVTLLHLGPGLGNGLANLHNARRARTPLVNVVGDHATYHKRFDAPLESDIDSVASTVSAWVRRPSRPADVGADAAAAVAAAMGPPGGVATLILPADVSWGEGGQVAAPIGGRPPAAVPDCAVSEAASVLTGGEPAVLLLGGRALRAPALRAAARVGAATGARVFTETHMARVARGAGRPAFERLGYFAEAAMAQLQGARHLVLAGATSPVAFFAYPGVPSDLVPAGCQVHRLAGPGEDVAGALEALADRLPAGAASSAAAVSRGAVSSAAASSAAVVSRAAVSRGAVSPAAGPASPRRKAPAMKGRRAVLVPPGPLSVAAVGAAIGACLPEGAVVVDEAITGGIGLAAGTVGAPPHDLLGVTGGAIGQGMPVATGAAVACPDRKVVCVEADGSAMYTVQALWTQAREGLDVTTVVLSNRAYAILQIEMHRVRASRPGPVAASLLDLSRPELDMVSVARGLGVPATRATTGEELAEALGRALAEPGPSLVDVVLAGR